MLKSTSPSSTNRPSKAVIRIGAGPAVVGSASILKTQALICHFLTTEKFYRDKTTYPYQICNIPQSGARYLPQGPRSSNDALSEGEAGDSASLPALSSIPLFPGYALASRIPPEVFVPRKDRKRPMPLEVGQRVSTYRYDAWDR